MADVVWVWNEPEVFYVLKSYEGPVGLHIAKLARRCTRTAKRFANVSPAGDIEAGRPPGYMRSKIRWDRGRDLIGVYADISSPARTARDNAPYGLFMEVGTRAHIIRPKRPDGWLRFMVDGRVVFAKVVHHPGTRPYAYLRRALASLRGA
ncbi:hypothetical protein ABZW11_26640 [Nonomuraea sp. NPDC004580]|uniref:hypothetical protein n=1 Tax=Nonomuraea sp. NPDC004580 TaxID=3154552 RepID=UPI0033BE6672